MRELSSRKTGKWCTIDCNLNCLHGGECSIKVENGADVPACDCTDTGYVGEFCNQQVECFNGGTLTPSMFNPYFSCNCPSGFSGNQCEIINSNPCLSNHNFITVSDYIVEDNTKYTYTCNCRQSYKGHNCLGPCELENIQCENGFACINYEAVNPSGGILYPRRLDYMCSCNAIQNRIPWSYPKLPVPDSIRIKLEDDVNVNSFDNSYDQAIYITSEFLWRDRFLHTGQHYVRLSLMSCVIMEMYWIEYYKLCCAIFGF